MAASFFDDPSRMKAFKYQTPVADRPKKFIWLAKTSHLFAAVQVVTKGGETNLHSHTHVDGFWFVLKGRARFYSDHEELFAELGPGEGVLAPRNVKYWFESAGDEPLELLQVEAADQPVRSQEELMGDRTDYGAVKMSATPADFHDAKS